MAARKFNDTYAVLLWFSAVFLTPIIVILHGEFTRPPSDNHERSIIGLFILLGLFVSAPIFLLVLLVHRSLRESTMPSLLLKLIVISVSLFGMLFTLGIIGGSTDWKEAYATTIVVAGLVLKAKKRVPKQSTDV